jgi:hypothetical protein
VAALLNPLLPRGIRIGVTSLLKQEMWALLASGHKIVRNAHLKFGKVLKNSHQLKNGFRIWCQNWLILFDSHIVRVLKYPWSPHPRKSPNKIHSLETLSQYHHLIFIALK